MQPIDILIVDDDPYLRYDLSWSLRDRDFVVFEAPDAAIALKMLRLSPRPLLVLLATIIPVMSGVRMLEHLASDPTLSPLLERHRFVLLSPTPHATRERVEHLLAAHDIPVLGTPLPCNTIFATIATMIESSPFSTTPPHAAPSTDVTPPTRDNMPPGE